MDNTTTWGTSLGVGDYDSLHAFRFLTTLHADQGGDIVLCVYNGPAKLQFPFAVSAFEQWTPYIEQQVAAGANIYVSTCQFSYNRMHKRRDGSLVNDRSKRKQADAVAIPGVWVDLDTKDLSSADIDQVLAALPPASILVDSGSGGRHAYWLYDKPLTDPERAKALTKSWLDYVRTTGQQALGRSFELDHVQDLSRILRLPGTVRVKNGPATRVALLKYDGPRYHVSQIESLAPPQEIETVHIGDFEIEVNADKMVGYITSTVLGVARDLAAETSARNSALNKSAFRLGRFGAHGVLAMDVAYDALYAACDANGLNSEDGDAQFEATFASGWTAGLRNPADLTGIRALQPDTEPVNFSRNDDGNAQRLLHYFGDKLRYLKDTNEWMYWDGSRWNIATVGDQLFYAKEVCRLMYGEAQTLTDANDRKLHSNWSHKSYSVSGSKNMIEAAKGLQAFWSTADDFDQKDYLLNVVNGTVDLRTGLLKPHDPLNMLTGMASVRYDVTATAPRWMAMVARAIKDAADVDPDVIPFVQKVLGYMLFGSNVEEKIFFAVGAPRCGKSKIGDIVRSVVSPDYAVRTDNSLIAKTRNGHHDSELFSIAGKRAVFISETSSTFGLDENHVKELTGEATITVRKLHDAKKRQVPRTWTIWLGSNNDPNVSEWDGMVQNRVIKIPFGPTIPVEERDGGLFDYIIENEAEGVLAWLIQGSMNWYRDWYNTGRSTGLASPPSVEMATQAYAEDSDHIGQFIAEMINLGPELSTPKSVVRNAFEAWAKSREKAVNRNTLYKRLLVLPGVSEYRNREFRGLAVDLFSDVEGWAERNG
jgi:P4 family phage/plasmid primase-like protien